MGRTMGSTRAMKPITREALRQFYLGHPMEPVPPETVELTVKLQQLAVDLQHGDTHMQQLAARVFFDTPTRIDDCGWRTRQLCEEAAHSLKAVATKSPDLQAQLEECCSKLLKAEARVRQMQEHNNEAAKAQVKRFLPQDFRMSMLEMRQSHQEAKNKKAVEDLVKRGGSIRDKYDLYLQQQWQRREALAQFGNLSGIYAAFVKLLAGIPQVLLDFAKQINAKQGPMEEQRIKYGPDFYKVTTLGIRLVVVASLWAEAAGKLEEEQRQEVLTVVVAATDCYTTQLVRVAEFISDLFIKSPFFTTAEDEDGEAQEQEWASAGSRASRLGGLGHSAATAAAAAVSTAAGALARLSGGQAGGHGEKVLNATSPTSQQHQLGQQEAGRGSFDGPHAHHPLPPALAAVPENASYHTLADALRSPEGARASPFAAQGGNADAGGEAEAHGQAPAMHGPRPRGPSANGKPHLATTASVLSEGWASADDNHSWYDPSRTSLLTGRESDNGRLTWQSTAAASTVSDGKALAAGAGMGAGHQGLGQRQPLGTGAAQQPVKGAGDSSGSSSSGPSPGSQPPKQQRLEGMPQPACCGLWMRRGQAQPQAQQQQQQQQQQVKSS